MAKNLIKKANFEKHKQELKEFAEQPATNTELDKFSTGGKWSDFWTGGLPAVLSGHKVTGEELNNLVTELQTCFSEINERDRKVIKEFGEVYKTFEALDQGYIQGILIGVKSAEKASQEAKDAQKDVDDTIKALGKTINILKEFKDEVNSLEHLKDVDNIWNDVLQINNQIKALNKKIDKQDPKIANLSTKIDNAVNGLQSHIDVLLEYKGNLERIVHLSDIDSVWNDVNILKNQISDITKTFDSETTHIKGELSELMSFSKSQKHFDSVDDMWDRLLSSEDNLQKCINELGRISNSYDFINNLNHINDIDEEWDYSHSLGMEIENLSGEIKKYDKDFEYLRSKIDSINSENLALKNKIKLAYIVTGIAMGVTLLQLVLSFMGIL